MELKEAIEVLKAKREERLPLFMDVRVIYEAIDTVLAELDKKEKQIKNYQNTIEVIEELGRMKIEKQIELARQKWGDK